MSRVIKKNQATQYAFLDLPFTVPVKWLITQCGIRSKQFSEKGSGQQETVDRHTLKKGTGQGSLKAYGGTVSRSIYKYGGGLARIISEMLANTHVTAEVTSASVDNKKLFKANDADLAFILDNTAVDAFPDKSHLLKPVQFLCVP